MSGHLLESIAEEELLTLSAAILLEEVMEASALETARVSLVEAASRATLSSHGVIRIIAVVISCSELCKME